MATAELNDFVLARLLEQITPHRITPTLVRISLPPPHFFFGYTKQNGVLGISLGEGGMA